ncbi:MAG: long-chain fatty acid--CoA ligase [Alphaproteobacteria bacterium]|nr:long-chain fatty acid--CoA ligase [Alphaproteobacteria bacterium]
MNLAEALLRAARAHGDRPGLALGTEDRLDYADFARRAGALGEGLRRRFRLAPGDRVALVMRNHLDYLPLLYGAWWAGLAAVPVNARLHAKEIAYILADCGARIAVATDDMAETVATAASEAGTRPAEVTVGSSEFERLAAEAPGAPVAQAASDLAWIFYTSGTTGRPKGAMLTHANLLAMTLCYFADVDTVGPGDSMLHAAPLSHGSGLYALPNVAAAAKQVIPVSGGFDGAEIAVLLDHHRGVAMFAAPTMVSRLVAHPAVAASGVPGLKTIIYGGAPMYVADLKRAIDVLGPRLAQIYGQGESPMTITSLPKALIADREHPRWEARVASAGIRQSTVALRIAGGDDRPLPAGEIGEILVGGPQVMTGYWNRPEATAETLKGGWLHTGDVGVVDEDGFLTLKDRSKDLIISGGANIYPREVEEVLLRHPDIVEAAVVGRPHPDWGEEVVAFVVCRTGTSVEESTLDRLCLDQIAKFKRPKAYRFVQELPKNNYGKVVKSTLRGQI